jgi:hypothetical protein
MSDTNQSWEHDKEFRLSMQQAKNVAVKKIAEQREEIIEAFMAKYHCGPEDVEQVVTIEGNRIRWYVHWRNAKPGGVPGGLRL